MRSYRVPLLLASVAIAWSAAPLRAEIVTDANWTILQFLDLNNDFHTPGGYADVEGPTANTDLLGHPGATTLRVQQVFAADQFGSAPLTLQEIRFRLDSGPSSAVDVRYPEVVFTLATTPLGPGQLSSDQDANLRASSRVATVIDGAIEVITAAAGAVAGPRPFSIAKEFTNPYAYDPTEGNLLLDVYLPTLPAGSESIILDATNTSPAIASRVLALDADAHRPVPEPSSLAILGLSGIVALIGRRLHCSSPH